MCASKQFTEKECWLLTVHYLAGPRVSHKPNNQVEQNNATKFSVHNSASHLRMPAHCCVYITDHPQQYSEMGPRGLHFSLSLIPVYKDAVHHPMSLGEECWNKELHNHDRFIEKIVGHPKASK